MGATGSCACFDRCDKWRTLSDQAMQEKITSLDRKYTTMETNYNTLHTKYSTLELKHEQLNKKVGLLVTDIETMTVLLNNINKKTITMLYQQEEYEEKNEQDELGEDDMVILNVSTMS